jgi:hypothetical protein
MAPQATGFRGRYRYAGGHYTLKENFPFVRCKIRFVGHWLRLLTFECNPSARSDDGPHQRCSDQLISSNRSVTALRTIQVDEGDASDLSDFDARRGRSSAQFSAEGAGRFPPSPLANQTRRQESLSTLRRGSRSILVLVIGHLSAERHSLPTKLTAVDDTSTSIRRYNRV